MIFSLPWMSFFAVLIKVIKEKYTPVVETVGLS